MYSSTLTCDAGSKCIKKHFAMKKQLANHVLAFEHFVHRVEMAFGNRSEVRQLLVPGCA